MYLIWIKSHLSFVSRGVGDVKTYYDESYASDNMLWIFNDIINMGFSTNQIARIVNNNSLIKCFYRFRNLFIAIFIGR